MTIPDETGRTDFSAVIRLLLDACPGPPMLRSGIRMAALQQVEGIRGLDGARRPQRGNPRGPPPVKAGKYRYTVQEPQGGGG